VWIALAVIALIKLNFDYFLIDMIALALTSANTAGYTKCRRGTLEKTIISIVELQ
jgi:hypothetical protein